MAEDSEIRRRRSIRLKGFDYSQPGAYFFTAVTAQRACIFGEVVNGEVQLSEAGRIVLATWEELPQHYSHVELGRIVVMPNHVHGIVVLGAGGLGWAGLRPAPTGEVGVEGRAGQRPAPTGEAGVERRAKLPEIVRAFKAFSARRINEIKGGAGHAVWQRNYYERVIRNHTEWDWIDRYIEVNPRLWESDRENPGRSAG